ncbi:MAG TPA: SWIM zinc finger family protein [Steroidobacter sp.]|nr:SWIM zinc finger family protein [Steroidobacteraceae bacterium]HLS80252.1 SWIM zinc finger family protein [Steroidobacter sp.]
MKVRKLGATWWGQRWISALELFSRDYLNRLGRGRTYARTGRVHDLRIAPGRVTASVTGSESEPYEVVLELDVFRDREWSTAIEAMAQQARFAAQLLAGEMPDDIDEVFRSARRSLFPRKSRELQTDCSCPDWANPCKHVAATHYVLGDALDRDPFLLFELRGRTREQVLAELNRLRTGEEHEPPAREAPGPEVSIAVTAQMCNAYDVPAAAAPLLRFVFQPPQTPAAILRSAPPPRAWSADAPPEDFFAEDYRRAAALARRLAMAGDDEAQPVIEETPTDDEAVRATPRRAGAAPRAKRAAARRSGRS